MASNSCCLCLGSIPHCHSCPRPSAHQPPDVQQRQKQQRSWQFCPRGGKPATPIACKTRHHLRPPSRKTFKTAPVPPQTWAPGEMRNNLCSYRQETQPRRVFHRHHTSKEIRRILGCKNDSDGFFCPTCRFCTGSPLTPGKFHDMTEEKRLRIVLSSSTLQGATIQDLLLMWRADYWNEKKPMDLLIIG